MNKEICEKCGMIYNSCNVVWYHGEKICGKCKLKYYGIYYPLNKNRRKKNDARFKIL